LSYVCIYLYVCWFNLVLPNILSKHYIVTRVGHLVRVLLKVGFCYKQIFPLYNWVPVNSSLITLERHNSLTLYSKTAPHSSLIHLPDIVVQRAQHNRVALQASHCLHFCASTHEHQFYDNIIHNISYNWLIHAIPTVAFSENIIFMLAYRNSTSQRTFKNQILVANSNQ
jgi:hypothetical protein